MDAAAPTPDAVQLAELAELGMTAARSLAARLAAAEASAEACELALALQRTGRMVRQTVALKAKLERDAAKVAADAAIIAHNLDVELRERRQGLVRAGVERAIFNQTVDDEDCEVLVDEACEKLDAWAEDADFLDEPLVAQIERLCRELGLAVGEDAEAAKAAAEAIREETRVRPSHRAAPYKTNAPALEGPPDRTWPPHRPANSS